MTPKIDNCHFLCKIRVKIHFSGQNSRKLETKKQQNERKLMRSSSKRLTAAIIAAVWSIGAITALTIATNSYLDGMAMGDIPIHNTLAFKESG